MTKSVFITIPRKAGATRCEHYGTVSLMSHLTKINVRVLLKRIHGRTAHEVAEEQFGFMPDKETRNVIFLLRMLAERSMQMQKDLYIYFLDYVKAFDRVEHKTLIEILELLDIDSKEIDLIADLYWSNKHVFTLMVLLVNGLQLNVVSAKDVTCHQIFLLDMLTGS